jgi:His-Xaa-Ser system protein HxsD
LDTFFLRATVAALAQGAGVSSHEVHITIPDREAAPAVVLRTAHRLSGRYAVSVVDEPGLSGVCISGTAEASEQVEREFRALLLDDLLRARIESETAPLRRLIVEAALRSALREPDAGA